MSREFVTVLMIVTAVLALTRAVRLLVDDSYPPIEALRRWYLAHTSEEWNPLIECPWCVAPYLALPAVIWGAITWANPTWAVNNWAWWLVNGWAAASWLAAYITLRDIPVDQRE